MIFLFRKQVLFFNKVLFFLLLLILISYWISPKYASTFGFLSWTIPVIIILIVFHVLIRIIVFNQWKIESLILLIFSIPHIRHTVSFHEQSNIVPKNAIHLVNYNVQSFNSYKHLIDTDSNSSKKMIEFISQEKIDVVCVQEFQNHDSSPVFNVSQKMKQKGFNHSFLSIQLTNQIGEQFGMAIFSKFPIIAQNEIFSNTQSFNKIMSVDLLLPTKEKDTIRVYSCHLQSLHILTKYVFNWKHAKRTKFWYQKRLLKKMKKAFVQRNEQILLLLKDIESSPYPVLLCGDFNEMPYSYLYHQILKDFDNSFVEKGIGFGFSLNKPQFPFLRIDNQFFQDKYFNILKFKTCTEIPYSDHFPLYGIYTLKKEKD